MQSKCKEGNVKTKVKEARRKLNGRNALAAKFEAPVWEFGKAAWAYCNLRACRKTEVMACSWLEPNAETAMGCERGRMLQKRNAIAPHMRAGMCWKTWTRFKPKLGSCKKPSKSRFTIFKFCLFNCYTPYFTKLMSRTPSLLTTCVVSHQSSFTRSTLNERLRPKICAIGW